MTEREIFEHLAEFQQRGIPVCLATIVNAAGSTPREIGAKMIVCSDGTTYGSVGGGCGENQVRSAALNCLLIKKQPVLIEVDLTDDLGTRGGDVCGGKMFIFVEPYFLDLPQ
jgi:xanthine dehydrogenase accessory factor